MQKNFEKSTDLKLKGVSSDKSQISSVYYSTKPEASSPYSRNAKEEEDDSKSICPFDSDFPPIETPDYQKQLRVLAVLDEKFELIWFLCVMNLCFQKTEIKEKISKVILLTLRKTVLRENG